MAKTSTVIQKWTPSKIFIAGIPILLLLLIYGAAFIALPVSILTQFQKGKCDTVLSLDKAYGFLYPAFVQDASLVGPVKECEVYVLAVSYEEESLWREAYDEYQLYSTTYPNGVHVKDSHEHAGIVLLNIVRSQIEGKEYEEALSNLEILTTTYSDMSVSAEAGSLFPAIYTSWGGEFRELGEFEQAERVFNEFKAWSQTNQKPEAEADANRALAQTNLDWGLALLSQEQYELALGKFDLALSAQPQSQPEFAAEVKAGQRQAYLGWGNAFLDSGQFSSAIEKFERAAALVDGKSDTVATDALANGHIQWALNLNTSEDFRASLEQLDIATDLTATDSMKQSLEAARDETYLAFSSSTGAQARQALKAALETICKMEKTPELPIFGIDKNSMHVGWYGAEPGLSGSILAKTPGEMHYVACVQEEKRTIYAKRRQLDLVGVPITKRPSIPVSRIQIFWHIELRDATSAAIIASNIFEGGTPPPIPSLSRDLGNGQFLGTPPNINIVMKWLESVLTSD